ncbi:MAG TPA: hypothetical protein VFC14_14360 [Burkholderiales bacterium]|nr:hypothetical protein [Burkholderiales bacterium]
MDPTLVLLLGALAVALAVPAAIRAYRIARFHRLLSPAAWPFIVTADAAAARRDGAGRAPVREIPERTRAPGVAARNR